MVPAQAYSTAKPDHTEEAVGGISTGGSKAVTPGDRLLYTLSARQDLSWSSFKKLFELLCGSHLGPMDLEDAGLARYETARGFDGLGHVELDLGSSLRI